MRFITLLRIAPEKTRDAYAVIEEQGPVWGRGEARLWAVWEAGRHPNLRSHR